MNIRELLTALAPNTPVTIIFPECLCAELPYSIDDTNDVVDGDSASSLTDDGTLSEEIFYL